MNAIKYSVVSIFLLSFSLQALEVVIKDGKQEEAPKEEEPKQEEQKQEEGPKAPEDAIVKVNAINLTNFDLILTVLVEAKDQEHVGFILQNTSPKQSVKTLGSLIAGPETVFRLMGDKTFVHATSPKELTLSCTVVPKAEDASKEDEKKDDDKQDDAKKEDTPAEDKGDDNPATQAPGEGEHVAKKSVDFMFYVPEGQDVPKCVIEFDSISQ